MSAKINIETEDPALATALGILIAKAIQEAGFTNALAKSVSIANPVTYPRGFGRVNAAMEHPAPEKALIGQGTRLSPELKPLRWIIPVPEMDFVSKIASKNPGLMDKPIALSFYPDTTVDYEKQVDYFLKHGYVGSSEVS